MKFHEVAVGEIFKFNNQEYVKIPEVRVSCCKIQQNAQILGSEEKVVLKPLDEVEKIIK
jgi:hypothetical protein